eukprot:GHRR01027938.1.p1 GENE.GHRR01027938.1~~GHRR01027938.1.p1  ORF type:complete len:116 (-),score=17.02 GHRR01027938.1:174-521(-)
MRLLGCSASTGQGGGPYVTAVLTFQLPWLLLLLPLQLLRIATVQVVLTACCPPSGQLTPCHCCRCAGLYQSSLHLTIRLHTCHPTKAWRNTHNVNTTLLDTASDDNIAPCTTACA